MFSIPRAWKKLQPSPTVCPVPGPRALARSNDPSRFWAVLIGIDAYPGHHLNGCVSDACAMQNYLINNLHVPDDHIQCLLCPRVLKDNPPLNNTNTDTLDDVSRIHVPTRANIVNTLLDLSKNTKIQFGDNIIIYFSGHGASYECQQHKNDPGRLCQCGIEALCPSDRNTTDASNNTIITDITDRELNVILTQICRAKGRKITVILDCCFSSSLTRSPTLPVSLQGVRTLFPSQLQQKALHDALCFADKTYEGLPEYRCILDDKWCPDMDSHVVLAACSEFEFAKEVKDSRGDTNGVFTQALLRVLKSDLKDDVTYESLLSLLPPSSESHQTPMVAGRYRAKRLWH